MYPLRPSANGKMTIHSTEREIDEVYRSYDLVQLLTMDWVKQNEVLKERILGWQKQIGKYSDENAINRKYEEYIQAFFDKYFESMFLD